MCFLGNLILSRPTSCEFYYDNVTVTSFINIKYGDVTVKFASRNEQRSDFGDCGPIGTGSVTAPAIQSRLGPSDYHLLTFGANGVNATWQKFASDTEMQSTARQWLRHQSTSFFSHQALINLLTDGINVQMNLDDTLKNSLLLLSAESQKAILQ